MSKLFSIRLSSTSTGFLATVVAVMVFLVACAGPPRKATWKNATGPGEYERLLWHSIQKKDWKEVEYHLSPTFIGSTPSGQVLDRAGWLEYWKAAEVQEASVSEFQVRPAGTDMTVTIVLRLSTGGRAIATANQGYRVISVWQQLKGGWTLTATSLTPIQSTSRLSLVPSAVPRES